MQRPRLVRPGEPVARPGTAVRQRGLPPHDLRRIDMITERRSHQEAKSIRPDRGGDRRKPRLGA